MYVASLHEIKDPATGKTWGQFLEALGLHLNDLGEANRVVGVWVKGQLVLASGDASKQELGPRAQGRGLKARRGGAGMFGAIHERATALKIEWGVSGGPSRYAEVHATGLNPATGDEYIYSNRANGFLFIPGPNFPKSAKPRDFKAHVVWRIKGQKGYLFEDVGVKKGESKRRAGRVKANDIEAGRFARDTGEKGKFLGTIVKRVRAVKRNIWTTKAFSMQAIMRYYIDFARIGKEAKIG